MIGRYLLLAFGLCALVIAFVPSDTGTGPAPASPDGEQQGDLSLNASTPASADWYAGTHTLARQPDGHFYADARVGGTPLRMMVDTGASVIALTGPDALAAGLSWDDAQIAQVGSGASGAVFGINTMLDEVEIGGMVRRNVRAVIIPQGLEVSLLGQSYLSQISSVKIAADKMVMDAQ
ncbi:retropepsin-like aspartic protease family protein [Parerythrobacter jejuensis]|uniref:TIGR02281 family clan AA aspartic protease n=1 Tax=Parerythrobacter jejuensis TaxID=795812 RepID=A0A845ALW0_9SPHN|nr:TIGR02281 family clan AA aspartic protease [Parerythrobacter jejuensis]MXP30459.1 TIGR02281 family clan AA aspartic protease [Parerythrobacter jejuensis]MXP33219.1 TIGR02281 family clan AA aspartic protease [Parerythrobacter jejuensis]